MSKLVLGIPLEADMLKVVNLEPGQSEKFLFYTIHFIDLHNPVGFNQDALQGMVANAFTICKRGSSSLSDTYLNDALTNSRYMLVAINHVSERPLAVGSILLARDDAVDPKGIYVEASCNTPNAGVNYESPEYTAAVRSVTQQVEKLTPEEVIAEYNALMVKVPVMQHKVGRPLTEALSKKYKSMIVSRRLKTMNITKPDPIKFSLRTAQLLKLTLFNYAKKALHKEHVYNAAAGTTAAITHATNGMTLRTAKCGQPDQPAEKFTERFASLSKEQQKMLLDEIFSKKTFDPYKFNIQLDSSGSLPMKLCNYNFDVMYAELLQYTIKKMLELFEKGVNIDDILAIDIAVN